MALTYNTKVGQGYRFDNMDHGLCLKQVEIVLGQTTDYVTGQGLNIGPDAAKFGFRSIYAVLQASVMDSGRTINRFLIPIYNPINGRLRFQGGAAEVTSANFNPNDIIRMVVIGV